jgi:putative transposase
MIRYDPRDMAEIRVFHNNQFLCRAVSPELAGETLSLRDLIRARNRRRRDLRHTLQERQRTVDALLDTRRWAPSEEEAGTRPSTPEPLPAKLKRYIND